MVECLFRDPAQTITPLGDGTDHLLISAYADRRLPGWDVRIIAVFREDSIAPLHRCVFSCDGGRLVRASSPARVEPHREGFGFPFVTTDVLCRVPGAARCHNATHVGLEVQRGGHDDEEEERGRHHHDLLPIIGKEYSYRFK